MRLALPVLVCAVLSVPCLAGAAENPPPEQKAAAAAPAVSAAEAAEAKQIFAAQCGWCHGSYGMTADKGPKLAGTAMTEQEVEERIRHGKPGYMPAFHRFLNDQQIALMAKYIKSLKP
ncbi:MAG: cytochrome c [Alphaproteobacteria bacterium]|nr:cytochrome c [Alphaproteobacteria bacterium]